jgi:aspartate aminotransferase-like enzyme
LHAAVRRLNLEQRFEDIAGMSAGLRLHLAETGFNLVGKDTQSSPAVITIALPPELNSVRIGEAMQEAGYLLSCNSGYLRRKNWIQICLMGECSREKIVPVANALNRVCSQRKTLPVITV